MAVEVMGTVAKVNAAVADATFKKAQEIVSSSKLNNVVFEGEFLEKASANCAGSSPGDSYTLSFCINQQAAANVESHCSCPAALQTKGGLCKHLVALFLVRIKELRQTKNSTGSYVHPTVSSDAHLNDIGANEKITTNNESSISLQRWEDMLKLAETAGPLQGHCADVSNVVEVRRRSLPMWMLGIVAGAPGTGKESGVLKEASYSGRKRKSSKRTDNVEREEGTSFNIDNEQDESSRPSYGSSVSEKGKGDLKYVSKEDDGVDCTVNPSRTSENEDDMVDLRISRRGAKGRCEHRESERAFEEDNEDTLKKRRQTRPALNNTKAKTATRNKKYLLDNVDDSDISEEESNENISRLEIPQCRKRLRRLKEMVKEDRSGKVDNKDQNARAELGGRLDLTMEELINIARKNLEAESSRDDAGDRGPDSNVDLKVGNSKKENSIFSSNKWKEVFPERKRQSDVAMCTPSIYEEMNTLHGVEKCQNEDILPEIGDTLNAASVLDGGRGVTFSQGAKLESTESVAENMFGLFFGPLSADNIKKKTDTVINPEAVRRESDKTDDFKELAAVESTIITANADCTSKKKSSLKDTVKMLLE